ncbi:MAG: hypothetical protein ABEJ03_01480 [Candidatus Nanohaloarchaea archaeon]
MNKKRRKVLRVCWNNYRNGGDFDVPFGNKKQLAEDLDLHRNTISNYVREFREDLSQVQKY